MRGVLRRRFFERSPVAVARDLIGQELVRNYSEGSLRGTIVEVEAYGGSDDPASHAYRGVTDRNRVMFGEAGIAYVYFTYGFHYCLNVVTGAEGTATAVLIRALRPIEGIEIMRKNRGNPSRDRDIANGPGKICQALRIDRAFNGYDMTTPTSDLRIERGSRIFSGSVKSSQRIGIRQALDKKWRFFDADSEYVSRYVNRRAQLGCCGLSLSI